jgi:O-acetylhomoserine (thiol)-lyase
MERHCANALAVAQFLESHPAVAYVTYAGLPSSRYHALAKKYTPRGPGALYTVGLKGGYAAGTKLVEKVNLWSHLANIGDAKSLILHPASTTHRQLTDEQRIAAGAGDEVIRLSVGIETAEDLIADLKQALEA